MAQVCARLDGIPLAIELVAARVRVLSIEQIADRMGDSFRLLTGGSRTAQPRQQTLRAAIDWSYDLLSEQERSLLRRLSVFAGGWTLEAAEAVCVCGASVECEVFSIERDGISPELLPLNTQHSTLPLAEGEVLDLLAALVDKSLVVVEEGDAAVRYRLFEAVRQYAHERLLAGGEVTAIRRQHASYFLTLAQEVAPEMGGLRQRDLLDRLEVEHDNVRAALAWTIEVGTSPAERPLVEEGMRTAAALGPFWLHRGHLREGRARLAALLALPTAAEPTAARVRALHLAGWQASDTGDAAAAEQFFQESLAISRALDDKWGIAASLRAIAFRARDRLPFAERRAFCEESLRLFRELGDELGIADALRTLGGALRAHGDHPAAQAHLEESLAIYRKLNDWAKMAMSLDSLGVADLNQGDVEAARKHHEESLDIYRELGSPLQTAQGLNSLGNAARYQGDWHAARRHYEESLAIYRELGSPLQTAQVLCSLGNAARYQDDGDAARRHLEESLVLFDRIGQAEGCARVLRSLGALAHQEGDRERAKTRYRQALILAGEAGNRMLIAACLAGAAPVIRDEGRPVEAARLLGAAAGVREASRFRISAPELAVIEEDAAATCAVVGEEAFAAAWAEGRAMALDQTVAYALTACSPD